MPQSQVVVIYSVSLSSVRRIVHPEDDSQVQGHLFGLQAGEAALVGSLSDYRTIGPYAMLARYLGRPPVNDRCAIVNAAGIVLGHLRADPTIDRHPLGTLYHDPHSKSVVGKLVNIPLY